MKVVKGGIFGNLEGSTKLKIFHASHDHEDVKSFTCKKAKRSVKLRQDRIIKGMEEIAVGTSMLEKNNFLDRLRFIERTLY